MHLVELSLILNLFFICFASIVHIPLIDLEELETQLRLLRFPQQSLHEELLVLGIRVDSRLLRHSWCGLSRIKGGDLLKKSGSKCSTESGRTYERISIS